MVNEKPALSGDIEKGRSVSLRVSSVIENKSKELGYDEFDSIDEVYGSYIYRNYFQYFRKGTGETADQPRNRRTTQEFKKFKENYAKECNYLIEETAYIQNNFIIVDGVRVDDDFIPGTLNQVIHNELNVEMHEAYLIMRNYVSSDDELFD